MTKVLNTDEINELANEIIYNLQKTILHSDDHELTVNETIIEIAAKLALMNFVQFPRSEDESVLSVFNFHYKNFSDTMMNHIETRSVQ
jgi:hypothetical protein